MGHWKMESFRFFSYVTLPVFAMWIFNQPVFYNWAFGLDKDQFPVPESTYDREQVRRFKEAMLEQQRKEDYARLLGEQLKAEESKMIRAAIIKELGE